MALQGALRGVADQAGPDAAGDYPCRAEQARPPGAAQDGPLCRPWSLRWRQPCSAGGPAVPIVSAAAFHRGIYGHLRGPLAAPAKTCLKEVCRQGEAVL